MARVQFETINEQNGRAQKTKENYLVEALSVSDVEDKMNDKFRDTMSEFSVVKVDESNIMGIVS